MTRPATHAAVLACSLLSAGAALAQGFPLGDTQRNWFEVQLLAPRTSSTLQVDPAFSSGTGTEVSLEDDLGLPRGRPAFGIGYGRRIGERWRFEVDYLRQQRSADTVLRRSLQIGDSSYAAGSSMASESVFQFARIVGGLSLVKSEGAEFGFTFGGALPRMRLSLQPGGSGFSDAWITADVLPMAGLFFSVAAAPGLQLSGRVEGGARDGAAFVNLALNAVWRMSPNLALGAGLRLVDGHSRVDDNDLFDIYNKRLDYRLGGPQLFATLSF